MIRFMKNSFIAIRLVSKEIFPKMSFISQLLVCMYYVCMHAYIYIYIYIYIYFFYFFIFYFFIFIFFFF